MPQHAPPPRSRLLALSLAALGVVYGDIGTSPLYAVRESLRHVPLNNENILGVLSLIFWSLILIISIKYLIFILRADNEGEGGTIALISLLKSKQFSYKKSFALLFLLGLFGTSLLFADGMITPAISVLSAIEGISIVQPYLHSLIVPIAFVILLFLFTLQRRGTERVGRLFGPFMIIWFIIIAILGVHSIIEHPSIIQAINPWHTFLLFQHYHLYAIMVLTGVFLVVTGGEALYADISHFGKKPIRYAWFAFVLPALLLNYFGQGADLLFNPSHINNPFYLLAPHWFIYPLLIIATIATIIASQAVISAVFSLTKQAIALDFLPRMKIIFSSHSVKGQVYVPTINFITMLGTLSLLIAFQTSSHLANAYGLAVNLDMIIVTVLVGVLSQKFWHWSKLTTGVFYAIFLAIDLTFLGANSLKLLHSGWFPIVFAIAGTLLMVTWRHGSKLLKQESSQQKITVKEIAQKVFSENLTRVPGVAIFINEPYDESKSCLFRHLESNNTIHEVTLLIDIEIDSKPLVNMDNRLQQLNHTYGIYHIRLHYGFMQAIDIPNTLRICKELKILPFLANHNKFTYYLEIVNVALSAEKNSQTPLWQKRLFITMLNNLTQNISFYHLPHTQTIMIGTYYDI